MNFGGWHALADAGAGAPEAPGVLQARSPELIDYPRGKSAMVLYAGTAANETLKSFVLGRGAHALARAASAGAHWVRFGTARDPDRELARLLTFFTERFGTPPVANDVQVPGDA